MTARLIAWMLRAGLAVLMLLPSSAGAQPDSHRAKSTGPLWVRDEFYSTNPSATPKYVFLGGGIPTSLRFPNPVDPSGTKLLGWEGRFEPLLIGGKTVVVVPLRDLEPSDRFLMVVKLTDGTEFPLTLADSSTSVDGVVNFFPDMKSEEAVRHALVEKTGEVEALKAEAHRERELGTSVDHALAALLARDQVDLTPFRRVEHWRLRGEDANVDVKILARDPNAKSLAGKGKVAVVLDVENKGLALPWELQEVRLTTSGNAAWPYAMRSAAEAIPRGAAGRMAFVVDLSTYDPAKYGETLVLDVFRSDGYLQASVALNAREYINR